MPGAVYVGNGYGIAGKNTNPLIFYLNIRLNTDDSREGGSSERLEPVLESRAGSGDRVNIGTLIWT